jgi:Viral coat protein P2 N-terminal domain
MVKYRVQLRAVTGVAQGKTAMIDLPCGPRYHYVVLQHGQSSIGGGANTVVGACINISQIRVLVNSRAQRVMSGTELRDMNLLNGTAYDCSAVLPGTGAGTSIPIYFAEPWRNSPADQDSLAWATAGWQTFQIQCDLLPTATGYATPSLVAWAVCDDFVPPANTTPGIVKWIHSSIPAAGTSFDYVSLDRRDWLQQISLYPDIGGTNAATSVTFKRNSVTLHELTNTANAALLTNWGMNPTTNRTANIYDMVLDHDGLLGSAVPMDGARDTLLTIAAGGTMSQTIAAIVQRLGPPE